MPTIKTKQAKRTIKNLRPVILLTMLSKIIPIILLKRVKSSTKITYLNHKAHKDQIVIHGFFYKQHF